MASIEENDLVSEETGTAPRSKNVAKRGRGRKRGTSSVSTRSTRSKKTLPNNSQGEEDEEEVEDTSQNDSQDSQEHDVSAECDVSNDSKNISVEGDLVKNGIVETVSTVSPETVKMETRFEANKSKSSVKGEVEIETTVKSKNASEHEVDAINERNVNVSENENTSSQKTDSAPGETAIVESEKVKDKKHKETYVKIEEETVNKPAATEDVETTLKASENKLENDKDISAVVEDNISDVVEDQKTSKANVATPKVVSVNNSGTTNDTSVQISTISEDAPNAKGKIAIDDEKNKLSTSEEVINIADVDHVNVMDGSTTVAVKDSSDVSTSDVVNDEKQVDSKIGNDKKQNDEDIKNGDMVSEVSASAISSAIARQSKPPDTSSIGSPMEEDISQYTVLEETNASQGSADEKVDDVMEVDESRSTDKKEREQSPEAGEMKNASMDDMTVIDEVEDEGDEKDEGARESKTVVKSHVQLDDTEMVSEDELPTETAKEPETEAVSDEELPEPTTSGDLPETEEVSEDELPPEKTEKKKKDSEVETPVESESVPEPIKKKKKSRFEAQKRKLPEGDTYDPSSPTSENSCDETPSAKRAALSSGSADSKAKQLVKGRKTLPELEKYWKAVKEDASDFTGWTYLLQYVDQESQPLPHCRSSNPVLRVLSCTDPSTTHSFHHCGCKQNDIDAAREAYDAFLSHYPYCYGYWRKYADYEKRKGNKEKCEEVFDRGLKAIPLSVDLWIHYLNYCKTTYSDDEEFLRTQFERALTACGMEFRSDRLWESFIKWETEGKRLQNVTAIYDRLLNMPTQGYTSHFENFQEHVSGNPPQKVLSVDEFLSLRREVLQLLKQYDSPGAEEAAPGEEVEAPPGEEPEETPSVSDEETTALRERIVSLRRKVHKATVAAVADRWNFEEGIKRPYFHVKPLERCQLKNWKEYLDFEIEKGDKERIITLFERCLIACALYEEFWLKFVRYLESEKNEDMIDKIRDVYERACTIHHPKKPNLHLHWSVFEENHKNYDKAAEILTNLEKAVPNLIQVSYRRINLERRRGNLDKVCSLYEHYISNSKNKVIANNMAIKYARFCWKVKSDVEKAISILNKAMEKDKENPRLYLQLIDMGLQRQTLDEAEIISTIDLFLSRDVDPEQKVLFAQRKVEFLEDFSADIASVQKSHDEFLRYCKQIKERKKKNAEDAKSESLSKKSKSGSGDSASSSQHASHTGTQQSHTPGQNPQPASQGTASQYATQGYNQSNYSQAPPTQGNYQGGQYATGSQPAGPYSQAPYNQQYSQSGDANYANYQNWGYSQPGYGSYNQGWGNYNYY